MQVYFYAKSGHTIGLEQTKKCAAIASALNEFDPILCTSDFRAGAFAKELLGVRRYVNIDVIRNMHNIMQRRDILLYNTDETNEEMIKGMDEFCSLLYNVEEIKEPIVDTNLYTKNDNPSIEKTIFFGDDDYYNQFIGLVENNKDKYDIDLLMGHYFFLGNEKIFTNHFANIIDEEEYVETIQNSRYLLTASLQSALEAISCGNNPVLFTREDKKYDEALIEKLNIPVISEESLENIINKFNEICENYPKLNSIEFANFDGIKAQIQAKVDAFAKAMGTE